MRKLILDCEALVVESFLTTQESHADDLSGPTCTSLLTKPTKCPCTPRDGDFF